MHPFSTLRRAGQQDRGRRQQDGASVRVSVAGLICGAAEGCGPACAGRAVQRLSPALTPGQRRRAAVPILIRYGRIQQCFSRVSQGHVDPV